MTAFKISGTPADCVRIALGTDIFNNFKPDVILSGINRGNNSGKYSLTLYYYYYLFFLLLLQFSIGLNVIYSGTVAGAVEGAAYE